MTFVKFNRKPLENSISGLIDDIMSDLPQLAKDVFPSFGAFVPVNIRENESQYTLEVVAPGFDKSDFKVNLEGNLLTISAEVKKELSKEEGKTIRSEFVRKNFKRSFTIDEDVDATGISASYINGVLVLNLPRKADVKESAKEIKIN